MRRIFIITAALLLSFPAFAQESASPIPTGSNEPLEITADKSLEWHRTEKQFIARVNTLAKQGPTSIASDLLIADYRETAQSSMDIYKVTAEGSNVLITSQETTATGQKAIYNLDKGYAEMTGNNLKLVSPDQTVTARDRFEYWITAGKLVAIGQAKVVRLEDTLEAEQVSAVFTEDAKGQRVLKSLEADSNVVITTPTEVLTGDKATYNAETNLADLVGNVKIKRGPNILEGDKAQVNLTTNVSTMYGGGSNGQVRGIFYPNSEKNPGGSSSGLMDAMPTPDKMTP